MTKSELERAFGPRGVTKRVKGFEFILVEIGSVLAFDLQRGGESSIVRREWHKGEVNALDHLKSILQSISSSKLEEMRIEILTLSNHYSYHPL